MSSAIIQLLVLAGIAIFLILRLGPAERKRAGRPEFDVIEGGPDRDIVDHVKDGSEAAKALAAMKMAEPGFSVGEFLEGARGAYEMILMAFESGDVDEVRGFLAPDVANTFDEVIAQRKAEGLRIDANFIGVREVTLTDASFDRDRAYGEISVRFVGELTSVVRDESGQIVEGNPNEIKRQRDVWTFARENGRGRPELASGRDRGMTCGASRRQCFSPRLL